MGNRGKLISTAVVVMVLVGVSILTLQRQPKAAPLARLILISYTNFTLNPADTNTIVFPGRGSWLRAKMLLTNEGTVSISYRAWGEEPYGWANVETDEGKTNGYLAPPFTGGTMVLRPGQGTIFFVALPTNTLRWQCGFDVEAASVRERAITRVLQSKLYGKVPEFIWYPVRLLSDKSGPETEVKSMMIGITNRSLSDQN